MPGPDGPRFSASASDSASGDACAMSCCDACLDAVFFCTAHCLAAAAAALAALGAAVTAVLLSLYLLLARALRALRACCVCCGDGALPSAAEGSGAGAGGRNGDVAIGGVNSSRLGRSQSLGDDHISISSNNNNNNNNNNNADAVASAAKTASKNYVGQGCGSRRYQDDSDGFSTPGGGGGGGGGGLSLHSSFSRHSDRGQSDRGQSDRGELHSDGGHHSERGHSERDSESGSLGYISSSNSSSVSDYRYKGVKSSNHTRAGADDGGYATLSAGEAAAEAGAAVGLALARWSPVQRRTCACACLVVTAMAAVVVAAIVVVWYVLVSNEVLMPFQTKWTASDFIVVCMVSRLICQRSSTATRVFHTNSLAHLIQPLSSFASCSLALSLVSCHMVTATRATLRRPWRRWRARWPTPSPARWPLAHPASPSPTPRTAPRSLRSTTAASAAV